VNGFEEGKNREFTNSDVLEIEWDNKNVVT